MRIVMLGASGYLGRKLTERLVEDNEILCVKREGTSWHGLDRLVPRGSRIEMADLPDRLEKDDPFDCFFNLACCYPRNARSDMDVFTANLIAPMQVFDTCLSHGVTHFFTVGTSLPRDLNTYALAKAELADIWHWYAVRKEQSGKPIQICNILLENFYGADEPPDRFFPNAAERILKGDPIFMTEGSQRRDLIYIDDVVRCLAALLVRPDLPTYDDVPVGTGENVPIRTVIEYLKEITGSDSALHIGAVPKRANEPDTCADREKMARYGLTIQYDWKTGMQKFIEEMRKQI